MRDAEEFFISPRLKQRVFDQLNRDLSQDRRPQSASRPKVEMVPLATPVQPSRARSAPRVKKRPPGAAGPGAPIAKQQPNAMITEASVLQPLDLFGAPAAQSGDLLLTLDMQQLPEALRGAEGSALSERINALLKDISHCSIDLSAQQLQLGDATLPFSVAPLGGLRLFELDQTAKSIKRL